MKSLQSVDQKGVWTPPPSARVSPRNVYKQVPANVEIPVEFFWQQLPPSPDVGACGLSKRKHPLQLPSFKGGRLVKSASQPPGQSPKAAQPPVPSPQAVQPPV